MKIRSFAHKGLKRLYSEGSAKGVPPDAAGHGTQLRYDALNKTQRIDALGQTGTITERFGNSTNARSAISLTPFMKRCVKGGARSRRRPCSSRTSPPAMVFLSSPSGLRPSSITRPKSDSTS